MDNIVRAMRRALPWGFGLFLFVLPWQAQYIVHQGYIGGEAWQYGTYGIYAIDALLILLAIVWIFFGEKKLSIRPKHVQTIWMIIAAIAVAAFFTLFFSADRSVSGYRLVTLCSGILLAYLLSRRVIPVKTAAVALSMAGVVQGVFAFVQVMTQRIAGSTVLGIAAHAPEELGQSVVEVAGGRFLRAYGTFQHPNILGGFLCVALAFQAGWYLTAKKMWERLAALASVVITATALFMTMSRSAWVATGVMLLVFASVVLVVREMRPFRRRMIAVCAAIVVTLGVSAAMNSSALLSRVDAHSRLNTLSVEERSQGYQDASLVIRDSWLIGNGIGAYTSAVHALFPARDAWEIQPVHNVFILICAELGIFGAIFFVIFIVEMMKWLFEKIFQPVGTPWAMVCFGALFSLLVVGLFDHYLWSLHSGVFIFWAVSGLSMGVIGEYTE